MPRVTLVRYAAKPDRAAENEALARTVFAEHRAAAPDHVATRCSGTGRTSSTLFINLQSDDSSAVTELPAFKAFAKGIAERSVAPPEHTRFNVRLVESYGLASAMTPA